MNPISDEADVFAALAHARQLIDTAMSSYGAESISTIPGIDDRRRVVHDLVVNTQQDLRCVVASVSFLEELVDALSDLDLERIGKHVHVTVLCAVPTAHHDVVNILAHTSGLELRIGTRALPDMLLIDNQRSLVRLSAADEDTLLIQSSEMVKLLHAFYWEAWRSAFDHRTYQKIARVYQCHQTIQIIEMLAQGHKDDVAARLLSMSVRTYRRYVAELMRDLNAQSRFQVGVWAAEMGLTGDVPEWR